MKRKDHGSREKMWFCEIKKEKIKRGSDVLVMGVKSEGKGSFLEASLLVNISTI